MVKLGRDQILFPRRPEVAAIDAYPVSPLTLDGVTIPTFDQEMPNFKARGASESQQLVAIE
jgi:hypothetical protein